MPQKPGRDSCVCFRDQQTPLNLESAAGSSPVRVFRTIHFRFASGWRFIGRVINSDEKLSEWVTRVRRAAWIAMDTEADSLHAYPEKLCLVQISLEGEDQLIDPLAGLDLGPLLAA